MTSDTVTKAADLGLSPTTLLTANGTRNTYANTVGAPNDGEYPAVNAMNCDSCHQTHDANTNSGTFILDAAAAKVTATTPRAVAVNLYGGSYTRTSTTAGAVAFQGFCTMCHTY
jgi:hypothetical protein